MDKVSCQVLIAVPSCVDLLGIASPKAEPLFCECLQANSKLSTTSLNGRHRRASGAGRIHPSRYLRHTVSTNAARGRGRSLSDTEAGGRRQLKQCAAAPVALDPTRGGPPIPCSIEGIVAWCSPRTLIRADDDAGSCLTSSTWYLSVCLYDSSSTATDPSYTLYK